MSPFISQFGLFATVALAALSAQAQGSMAPATPSPAPKTSATPASPAAQRLSTPLPYRSVFDGYQAFTDAKPLAWKDTNTSVETLGGWRTYSKEASEPAASDAVGPATPSPNPHAGHHMHGKK